MNFKIYYKKSRQPIATFDENTIVDFCLKNKDTLKNYYFSSSGNKEMMEWEVFTVRYSELFEKKAIERDKKEFESSNEGEIKVKKQGTGSAFTIILLALLIATYSTYLLYQKKLEQDARLAQIQSNIVEKKVEKKGLEKRAPKDSDTKFTETIPEDDQLIKLWDSFKGKEIKSALDLKDIKDQMDSYLPQLKECYIKRAKAGDTDIRGTINLKIRVSGDGVVRDVLLPDEKYRSTLFGDCIISAVKSKKFKIFKSREQVFTYYWNL